MIFSLIKVGLLCIMGVGANKPTPINYNGQPQHNYKHKNNVNDAVQNFSLNVNNTASEIAYNQYGTNNEFLDNYQHYSGYTYNNVLEIYSNTYEQNELTEAYNEAYLNTGWAYDLDTMEPEDYQWDNVTLRTFKITSLNEVITSGLTLNFQMALRLFFYQPGRNDQVIYHTKVSTFMSINDNWDEYMTDPEDNWTANGYEKSIYDTITNSANGYDYNKIVSEHETIQEGNTPDQTIQNVSQELPIVPDKTNYVLMFIQTRTETTGITGSSHYGWDSSKTPYTLASTRDSRIYHSDTITFSGTYYSGTVNIEVVDVPGMMWEILTMPFAFISQAFNLTIFPGTPYQVNISNLILMVVAIAIFVFIMKLIIKRL